MRNLVSPILSTLISWTMIFSPLTLAQQPETPSQAPVQEQESNYSKLMNLLTEMDILVDRAFYPNIPRRQGRLGGLPTQNEISQIQTRIAAILQDLRINFAARIQAVNDPEMEGHAGLEIETFYNVVQRFEGLKIILGQKVSPESWNTTYGLALPVENLAQLKFFDGIALSSQTDVEIEGRKSPVNWPMDAEIATEGDKTTVYFRVSPDFVEKSELQYFLGQFNSKAALMFAGHFAAHKLFESQNTINELSSSNRGVPEAPQEWQNRFASFKVKRGLMLQARQNQLLAVQKPKLTNGVYRALIALQKQDGSYGFGLDQDFWNAYQQLSGKPLPATLDLGRIKINENATFRAAFSAVVRLWSLRDLQKNLGLAILFAKKLSLRWMIVANADFGQTLNPVAKRTLELTIDSKAGVFTNQLINHPLLADAVKDVLNEKYETVRQKNRLAFHQGIDAASKKMRNYQTRDVSPGYISDMQRAQLESLDLAGLNKTILGNLEKAQNYRTAYLMYKNALFNILQAYRMPRYATSAQELKLDYVYQVRNQISFNPDQLTEVIPKNYIDALNADPAGRKKDIKDLIEIGRLFKFHVYENLPEETLYAPHGEAYQARVASPRNLKIEDRTLGAVIGSEQRRYVEAMKKDLFSAAPILGGTTALGPALWEIIGDSGLNGNNRALIDAQVDKVGANAAVNVQDLEKQIKMIEAGGENSIAGVGEEMRTIVTRTTQMAVVLSAFSSFKGYYDEIRSELSETGFWGQRWENFNSWTLSANMYLLGFYVANLFSSRFAAVGKATDFISKSLAPIFGVNFSRLTPIIFGMLGIGIAGAGTRVWNESGHASTVAKYFECSAMGSCVSLYSDVVQQNGLRNAAWVEFGVSIIAPILLIGGFIAARYAIGRLMHGMSARNMAQLNADLKTLDIRAGSELTERGLRSAMSNAVRTARGHADPRVAEIGAAYAEQAYLRIQQMLWKETQKALAMESRFAEHFAKLKISAESAKNPQLILNRLSQIKAEYDAGRMTTIEFIELKNMGFSMYTAYAPTWAKMGSDPGMHAFYNTVWKSATNSTAAEVTGNLQAFNSRIAPQFNASMNEFFGTGRAGRSDSVLNNLIKELEKNPDVTNARLAELRRLLVEGAKK